MTSRTGAAFSFPAVLFAAFLSGAVLQPATAQDATADSAALRRQAETLAEQNRFAEAEALLKQAIGLLEARPASGGDMGWLLDDLADIETTQGRFAEAEAHFKRAIELRRKEPGAERLNLGASLNGLAGLYQAEGRFAEAESLYREDLDIVQAAHGAPPETLPTVLTNLALIYQKEGRYAEAEPLYRRAVTVVSASPELDRTLGPVIRNNLAGLDKQQGRFDEAETLYRAVLDAREKQGAAPLDLAASLNNLAQLYDAQKRFADAEPLLQRALTLREQALGPDHPDVAQALNNLAGIYWAEHDAAKAEPLLRRALDIKEKTLGADNPEVAAGLNNLAVLHAGAGRLDEALAASTRAVASVEAHLTANAGGNAANADAEYRKDRAYFANYVEIAYGIAQDQPERAAALAGDSFRAAQLAQQTNTASAVTLMAARIAAGSGGLADAIRQRQDLAARWRSLDADIVALAARPATDPDKLARSRAALAETRGAIQTIDTKLAAERPDYAALAAPKPIEAASVQRLLAPDEAMLVYFATSRVTWLWAVRPDGVALFKLAPGARALAAAVDGLRATLTPDLPPFPARDAHDLYEQILAPATAKLAGAHRLIVVPDGALQSLPFALLVTDKPEHDPERPEDDRAITWLARRYAVSVLPAVSSLPALRQMGPATAARKPFLGIGNPVLAGLPTGERGVGSETGLRAAGDDVRRLPALPDTADELRAIAKTVGAGPADLLLGAQASEAALRQTSLDQYRIVEFATHGLLSGELKGLSEPALVLTPPEPPTANDNGLLTASKIAGLKLDADWVVLSACNTAESDSVDTGGWSALAKSFFYAGARSLLISHWPVWSKATVALTSGVFNELKKDPAIGRAEALRRAEMAMLDPGNPPEFAHPLAWAPFVLAGEGGAGR